MGSRCVQSDPRSSYENDARHSRYSPGLQKLKLGFAISHQRVEYQKAPWKKEEDMRETNGDGFKRAWFEVPTRKPDHRRFGEGAKKNERAMRRRPRPCSNPSLAWSTVIQSSGAGPGRGSSRAGCMRLG